MSINKSSRNILILGAGSDMARPFINLLFKQWQCCTFYLLARNTESIKDLAEQGTAQGHKIELHKYDLEQPEPTHFINIEFCITYAGWLPHNNDEPEKTMLINCSGIEHFLNGLIQENKESLKSIIITGSIAGVRVRPANKAYGLAKQALHKYAIALQKKLAGKIAVTLVIPGYVRTRMLLGMNTPAMLTMEPEELAKKYKKWMISYPGIVYSQPIWRAIGFVLKTLPKFFIKRMKK